MDELKPCPFCGREVKLMNVVQEGLNFEIWVIEHLEREPICFLWHARGYEGTREDIIELWNRRAVKWE